MGDTVVVQPILWTATATCARRAATNLCRQMGFIGLSGGGGGLSEKILVDARSVHPIGDLPLDETALIGPLSVARHAGELFL